MNIKDNLESIKCSDWAKYPCDRRLRCLECCLYNKHNNRYRCIGSGCLANETFKSKNPVDKTFRVFYRKL